MKYKAPLHPENTYHIYNRGNGDERIFLSDDNYRYFLNRYRLHIDPIAILFCYCLMPNHFHFVVKMKSEQELTTYFAANLEHSKDRDLDVADFPQYCSDRFRNFFNAYSKAFNKQQHRRGSLFMRPYKRVRVYDDNQLRELIRYVHLNPVKARLAQAPDLWEFSSYKEFFAAGRTGIRREDVLSLFDGPEHFVAWHRPEGRSIHAQT